MTAAHHDDHIEVLSVHPSSSHNAGVHNQHHRGSSSGASHHHHPRSSRDSRCYTYLEAVTPEEISGGGTSGLHTPVFRSPTGSASPMAPLDADEEKTDEQKRVARAVMVIASLMILTSVLLVTVTLSMSDHIDEMGEYTHLFRTIIYVHHDNAPTVHFNTVSFQLNSEFLFFARMLKRCW